MLSWIKLIQKEVDIGQTKIFSFVASSVCAFFALRRFVNNEVTLYYLFLSVSVVFLFSGLLRPQIARPLHLLLAAIFKFILVVITSIVLCFVYFFVVTPIGWCIHLLGKDLLDLKKTYAKSYWHKNEEDFDKERYLKQY